MCAELRLISSNMWTVERRKIWTVLGVVVDVIGEDLEIAATSVKDSIQDVVMRGDGHVRKNFLAEFFLMNFLNWNSLISKGWESFLCSLTLLLGCFLQFVADVRITVSQAVEPVETGFTKVNKAGHDNGSKMNESLHE